MTNALTAAARRPVKRLEIFSRVLRRQSDHRRNSGLKRAASLHRFIQSFGPAALAATYGLSALSTAMGGACVAPA
jgi:hypothetical protein